MKTKRHRLAVLTLATVLVSGVLAPTPASASSSFDDRYVFAATRGVNDMHGHPAVKMPLYPVAFALDVAALPFAVIAGFVG